MSVIYANIDTGDDTTGDGSSGTPYKTWDKAHSVATTDDTIELAVSTNAYTVTQETLPAGLTVRGSTNIDMGSATAAFLDWGAAHLRLLHTGDTTYEDIVFQNAPGDANYSIFDFGQLTTAGAFTAQFTRCIFRDLGASQATASRGGIFGAYFNALTADIDIRFDECAFSNLKAASDLTYAQLIRLDSGTLRKAYFTHCTFYWDSTGYPLDQIVGDGNTIGSIDLVQYKNCILFNEHAETIDLGNAATETMDGCLVEGNFTATATNTNATSGDPLFVDKTVEDFRLRPASPAIGGGQLI